MRSSWPWKREPNVAKSIDGEKRPAPYAVRPRSR